eukprot:2111461-Pleurochrysis_carterae.AAC.1
MWPRASRGSSGRIGSVCAGESRVHAHHRRWRARQKAKAERWHPEACESEGVGELRRQVGSAQHDGCVASHAALTYVELGA